MLQLPLEPRRASRLLARAVVGLRLLGGPGSGHHGHAGRPGEVGGSAPGADLPEGLSNTVENRSIRWEKQGRYYVNAESLVLYHGTTESRAGKIEAEGLKFGNLALTPEYALEIAKVRREGDQPVVFRVETPAGSVYPVFHGSKGIQTDALSLAKPIKSVSRLKALGGPGSGHHGHAGRPGEVGGSASGETFHGTRLDVAKKIKKEGLRPGHGGRVYVAHELDLALNYASQSTGKDDVAVVVLSKEAAKFFNVTGQQHHPGTYHYSQGSKTVPSKFIKEVRIYSAREIDKLREGQFPYQTGGEKLKYKVLEGLDEGDLIVVIILDGSLKTLGGPGSGHFGHEGRPGEVGGSAPSDLGETDLPRFDEDDPDTPEWKAILAHDAFLDKLDDGASMDDDLEKMRQALDDYVHAPDRLNNALRENPDLLDLADHSENDDNDDEDDDDDRPRGGHRLLDLAKTGAEVENAMADAPKIKQPVTVYRGLRGVKVEDFVKGDQVTLNGFQSTSFDPKVAAAFMGSKTGGFARGDDLDGILLKIDAKYGIAFGHAHSIEGEMEMLLPHGDTYQILGIGRVRHQGRTFPLVHLRQR
ncbi:MAG TPA: ADP-ribosyltransferase [Sphingomicrobium sp.]|nr:ADP-ribosyltransferase [Sphingomicrobium sp.]